MTYNTISDAVTMQGGLGTPPLQGGVPRSGEGVLLANRYRVVRQLGAGGMGSVWLAEDTQLDNKRFAIKMLPSILVSNKRAYRQLKDEALVAMRLVHPNIVQIRAFEENDGNPFLVMDYIDGETLDDYLADREGLPESEVIRLLRPIAAALDYAHGEGVVHRDVKPANVMIRKDGHPFILDFGIAREIQETMTRVTGKLSSGTLLYMSSEQLNGDPPRKEQDIYSFAAMAYECLKGEPPFVRGAIEDQIKNKIPEPLPSSSPETGEVAEGRRGMTIASSVMSGLAKKPGDRPPTCAAVLSGDVSSGVGSRVPRDRDGRAGSPMHAENGRAGAPRTPQQPSVDSHNPSSWKASLVAASIALAVLGVLWWKRSQTETSVTSTAARTAQQSRTVKSSGPSLASIDEEMARAAAIEIRIEARVWQSRIAHISDADGFGRRKNDLVDLFARAEANFDDKVKNWSGAAQGFTNYVTQCKALKKLDDERQSATESRAKSAEAKRRAESAESEKYAPTRWREAVGLAKDGEGEFAKMRFTSSGIMFASAADQFEKCISDAKSERSRRDEEARQERERQERLAKEKREREERESRERAERSRPKHGDTKVLTLPGGVTMEMIYVSPGEFMMGSSASEDGRESNETQHRVEISKGFWLGKYEVTQEQWESVMGENPSNFKGGRNPVECVSWEDCQRFIEKVNARLNCGVRLPTEAEWEYACRAGTTTAYFWGNALNGDRANCNGGRPCGTTQKGRYLARTSQVGSYYPNQWGFYDMHGNVWEWCNDWYGDQAVGGTDPQGPSSGEIRVLRGGCWFNYAQNCRSALRNGIDPGYRRSIIGFRLCCSAGPRE